ncbi:hypothetical protein EJ03DRAFT_354849 [Teratosphaeria nubilosa]|uniref:F-box domain-containing protein n=1 Tax=Teratosphaeria nubilosa TaxID=161662 RepID=A0A6G1KYY3_9PEZI|nr:hypothetical protein EJ03DRAFT_354849 [Teratosphaeria nubilosa]
MSAINPHSAFLELPPEIRDIIYELVFVRHSAAGSAIRISNVPSKALLITCRQIYHEANAMYKHAYCSFWRQNKHVVDQRGDPDMAETTNIIQDPDLAAIHHLTILTTPAFVLGLSSQALHEHFEHRLRRFIRSLSQCPASWRLTRGGERVWKMKTGVGERGA